ncbi:BadF/BadG/BcrA/BcrD ATPase family protein [Actinomadura algeriensis]|uniref:N-acetylglucosamine kinase-like BadF-type ATPase n=1 Tax=Actinomadura algeriensis TaxID=1679523 RepID=A0ABR9JLE7_9ACTN|nr:N-acetylglucosamine kinase-like BadF-type ATPase [Actinomadura algeriensis]
MAGSGTGPGANPNSGGDTAGALSTALREALGDLDRTHVLTGVFGIAGAGSAGRPAAVTAARRAWQAMGLRGSPAVVTDIAVAFAAGTSRPKGIVVFSGTGAGAAVISDGTIVQRADGYGFLVGDEGSAVWLGKEAVRAALAAYDGRGSPTLLTDSVPRALLGPSVVAEIDAARRRQHRAHRPTRAHAPHVPHGPPAVHGSHGPAGVPALPQPATLPSGGGTAVLVHEASPAPHAGPSGGPLGHPEHPGTPPNPQLAQAIIKEVYGRPASALGRLGPVVAAAAAAGDPVAKRITEEAAASLLRDVDAVRPALSDDPCAPVVMHGSVLREGPVADAVRSGLRHRFAEAPRSAGDGAVGAAGLALRRLGHPLPC